MIDLGPIKARLVVATKGPWVKRPASYGFDIYNEEISRWVGYTATPLGRESPFYPPKEEVEANATLMASSPTDISALIEEVERLRAIIHDLGRGPSEG